MSIHIQNKSHMEAQLVEAGDRLVVVDFFATWCGPCKMIAPKLEDLAKEMAGSILVFKVDVDECEDIAVEYNIVSMPTFVFMKCGKKVDDFTGANYDRLVLTINKYTAA